MSSYKQPVIFTYEADGVIAADKQYHLAKFGSKDDSVVLSDLNAKAIGVIMTKPCGEAGEQLEIAGPNGGAVVKVAAAIARGEYFSSDADGKAVVAADRSTALGQIDESATAADQVVACVLF